MTRSFLSLRWVSKDGLGAIGRLFIGIGSSHERQKVMNILLGLRLFMFLRRALWEPF